MHMSSCLLVLAGFMLSGIGLKLAVLFHLSYMSGWSGTITFMQCCYLDFWFIFCSGFVLSAYGFFRIMKYMRKKCLPINDKSTLS